MSRLHQRSSLPGLGTPGLTIAAGFQFELLPSRAAAPLIKGIKFNRRIASRTRDDDARSKFHAGRGDEDRGEGMTVAASGSVTREVPCGR